MYKSLFFIIITVFLTSFACNTGKSSNTKMNYTDYNFEQAWIKVDSLKNKGLYKSALKIVDEIFVEAVKNDKGGQKIKALFYKGTFTNYLEEDNLESFEKVLRKEITKANFPDKQMFQSILAEFYDKYLSANNWKIRKRTETGDSLNDDIQTWSTARFITESNKLYNESISEKKLKDISYSAYKEVFTEPVNTEKMRDNLYEILVNRALDHFKNDRNYLPTTTDAFRVNDSQYFSTSSVFTELNLKSIDKSNAKFKTLFLFQQLEKHNLQKGDFEELIDIVLKRLDFVKGQYIKQDKDKLYLKTLNKLIDKYKDTQPISEVYYKKAVLFKNQGEQKNAAKNKDLKWKIKESLDICNMVDSKYPNTLGSSLCRQLKYDIKRKHFRINIEKVNLPDENILVNLEYKNVNKAYFKLAKLNVEEYEKFKKIHDNQFGFLNNLSIIKSWNTGLPNDNDFRTHRVETDISPQTNGIYVLLSSNNDNFRENEGVVAYQFLHVSDMAYWTRSDKKNNYLFVVDRKTGKAIKNAEVELSYMEWDRRSRERKKVIFKKDITNFEGYIKFNSSDRHGSYFVKVTKGDDILNIDENIYTNRYYPNDSRKHIMFFTDRSIYRPGQTVYYKGIMIYNDKHGIPSLEKRKQNIKLEFKDANYQKISDISIYTNDFGSFNGSFTIPQSGLTGNMTIMDISTGSNISFKVEEYKRPKFEVSFDEYKESYKLGDIVKLKGKAASFSGFPIQGAKVVYTVKRKVFYPYYYDYYFRRPSRGGNIEIAHGITETDENGKYIIPVELFAKDIDLENSIPSFTFEINASVVDLTGETHSTNKYLNAGVNEVNISMNVDGKIKNTEEVSLEILSTNHSGQEVDAQGIISIFKLQAPENIYRKRFWAKPDTFIYSREEFYNKFPSYSYKNDNNKLFWKVLNKEKEIRFNTKLSKDYKLKLSDGEYKIVLEFDDPSGKQIKIEKFTSIYSNLNNPAMTLLLTEFDEKTYTPTTSAKIRWQSAVKGLNIYYTLSKIRRDVIGKGWLGLSKNKDLTIKILDEHRGGIMVSNNYVFDNRFHSESKRIDIPWSNKELEFEYTNFRSKLYPGQDEEWRIKISGVKSSEIIGEVLANMYDASLDKIYKRDWSKSIHYPSVESDYSRSYGFGLSNVRFLYNEEWRRYPENYFNKEYRRLNWFGFSVHSFGREVMYSDDMVMRSSRMTKSRNMDGAPMAAPMAESKMNGDIAYSEEESIDDSELKQDKSDDGGGSDRKDEVQLRTNLNETVFFFPEVRTDKDGDFILKFKMNDALTKWKFRMFSHTKDLKFGYDEKEIITQKELMITPNNPRFVRESDVLTFKARIDNLTENVLSGNAWIELYDAESMKPLESVFLKGQKDVKFEMDSKGSALVSWKIAFPKNVSNLLIYRFYAKSGDFSDAEEGILPVLTNQKLVTETMPLWVKGKQTKSFTFKSLQNSKGKDLKNINFTIEATSHPLWLAIQSLPYLKNVDCENSISYTNALFSNLLAKKITDDNPKIKRVFERWKNAKTGIDKEALLSNLSKNQELKNILLEETPWVLDAINEEQQKRNIALLFDLNQVQSDRNIFVRKLKGLQNPDGGFPWFKRGKSSRYITQYIIETFGRMKKLGLYNRDRVIDNILKNAIRFVNDDVVKNYKELLKLAAKGKVDLKTNHLGSLMIHYMYAIQFYSEIKMSNDLKEAYDYYFGQARKYWLDRPLYLKGMLALVLHRGNESGIAKEILRAAEEQSIISEELGMYWKSYHGYHWWQLPIETQALMVEAFDEVNNDLETVSQLKIWLLKNKQTNRWKTDKATVSAIYSLLFDQGGTINETGLVKIYVAGNDISKDISKNDVQSGTGYYKKKWSGGEVKPSMSEIKIENPNKDIAWGAVYWQYLQDLDKIETFEDTPLKINRSLYLVKNTDKGEVMTKINQDDILNPGDLIKVKIRLEVDREMEFVHLSDQRAATFEPLDQLSGHKWQGGLGYYQNPRDTKMNFFIDFLPRGVFTLEYPLRVTQTGTFSNGIAELQSYYAPEFSSHSEGLRVKVK